MKYFLYLILVLGHIMCAGQPPKVAFASIVAPNAVIATPEIDFNDQKWKMNAKLIVTDVADNSTFSTIKVKSTGDGNIIPGLFSTSTNEGTFDLSSAIENKDESSFKLLISDVVLRTLDFKIKPHDDDSENPGSKATTGKSLVDTYIGALTNANFVGNNKFLANLTPAVNLGTVVNLISSKKFTWELDVNPYMGGEIDTKSSQTYIPALMLYGRAGIGINNYLKVGTNKFQAIFMPFNVGLKLIPNLKDDDNVIIQHNIRPGLAIKLADAMVISGQATFAWHGLTSQSKETFAEIMGNKATFMSYLTVVGQFAVKGKDDESTNYLFAEWRSLLSKKRFPDFTNVSILTIGIRKTLELRGNAIGAVGKDEEDRRSFKRKRTVHLGL